MKNIIIDNKGRRSGIDRRSFSYAIHLPERRSEKNRRSSIDRRSRVASRSNSRPTDDRTKHFAVCSDDFRTGLRKAASATVGDIDFCFLINQPFDTQNKYRRSLIDRCLNTLVADKTSYQDNRLHLIPSYTQRSRTSRHFCNHKVNFQGKRI